jgi:hypothetical protein
MLPRYGRYLKYMFQAKGSLTTKVTKSQKMLNPFLFLTFVFFPEVALWPVVKN